MAQPAQQIWGPSGEYNVIDNGAAGSFTSGAFPGGASPHQSSNWIRIQADRSCQGFDTTTGAVDQSTNAFKNGTVPDFGAAATVVLNSSLSTRLLYKNP